MLTLSLFKQYRVARDVRRPTLVHMFDLDHHRLRNIEQKLVEPWFHEAVLIARGIGVASIEMLIDPADIMAMKPQEDIIYREADLQLWREGARFPLSTAFRLARHFGLDKVDDLVVPPLVKQIWAVVERNERASAHLGLAPICPWCLATGDHLPTCLPHNLIGSRSTDGRVEVAVGVVQPGIKGKRKVSAPAYGIKALRENRGWRQIDLAEKLATHPNYLARIERGVQPLSLSMARKIAAVMGMDDIAPLYVRPADEPAPTRDDLSG